MISNCVQAQPAPTSAGRKGPPPSLSSCVSPMRSDRRRATLFRYGSVCSGMEAATLAWEPLGWECAFVSEIDKAPCDLLEQRISAPNLGDMTKFEEWPDYAIDLLVGGTPCQSFSVAGLRKGLADPRGSLMLTYGAIAKRYRPRWLVWENVPGVLSDDGGRSFGTFLGMLGELGYGFAYRVLDAQYFGLAQRRARVFVVGYLGDWRPPAAVLFESESLRGDSPPRREAGQRPAPTIAARTRGGGGLGTDFDCDGGLVTFAIQERAVSENLENGPQGKGYQADHAYTLEARNKVQAVAFNIYSGGARQDRPDGGFYVRMDEPTSKALDTAGLNPTAHQGGAAVLTDWAVRRLTPLECERLQGAPDDWTNITRKGKPIADGPRYKMLGNSMAVPVMRWIGDRIELVDAHIPKTNNTLPGGDLGRQRQPRHETWK